MTGERRLPGAADVAATGDQHNDVLRAPEIVGQNVIGGFDTEYYPAHNADVADAGVDPLVHFNTFGWHEGRNPNAYFDTTGYLAHYADVAAAGVDPLQHYETFGWKEGRDPSAGFERSSIWRQTRMWPRRTSIRSTTTAVWRPRGPTAINDGLWHYEHQRSQYSDQMGEAGDAAAIGAIPPLHMIGFMECSSRRGELG